MFNGNHLKVSENVDKFSQTYCNFVQGQTSGFFCREGKRERESNHVKEKVVSKQTQFERESDKFAAQVVVV